MDDTMTDDQIRRFYRENRARVDLSGFTRELAERLPEPRVQSARRVSRTVRLASYATAAAVFLFALGFGVNALVERMSQDKAVVVITDDSMSPGAAGPGSSNAAGPEKSALTGAKAELWTEIQRIREGVKSGELTFGWTAAEAAGGDLPSDPMLMLDSLERSLLSPDVTAYLRDSAGEATALRTEISAMPGVAGLEFVSKDEALQKVKETFADNPEIFEGLQGNPLPASLEIWLNDYSLATSLADELRSRPEVDEVQARAATMDYAQWVERLRSLTHPSDTAPSGTSDGSPDVHRPISELYGFDVHQPFVDHEATAALGDPAYKIVTTWVAVGNRQETPLAFSLSDLTLIDAHDGRVDQGELVADYYYTETVAPIWTPALEDAEIAPDEVIGGYVSWKVPWYVWPQTVMYSFPSDDGRGSGHGWQTPIFSDLNSGNRYYLAIGKLLHRGVIKDSTEEPFRPDAPVTVAEFARMAVIADAPYNKAALSYPGGYIEQAKRDGLTSWGSKSAAQTLTRLEVALTTAQIGGGELSDPPADYTLPFTDIPEVAKDHLALLAYNGVINGSTETSFDPEVECSRGQASQMLALVLDARYREEQSRAGTSPSFGVTTTTD